MTGYSTAGIAPLLAFATAALAAPLAVHTPAPGSPERTAIVKTLHAGDDSAQSRFTFRAFRVLWAGPGAIAYVRGAGPVGTFQAILKRDGRAGWRKYGAMAMAAAAAAKSARGIMPGPCNFCVPTRPTPIRSFRASSRGPGNCDAWRKRGPTRNASVI